ncbi:MAG: M48 family metalloprotease [Gammaproteobacteria bacterium]|nr:M48 family metalloprotease [Gammaproteobacteria bacterium]
MDVNVTGRSRFPIAWSAAAALILSMLSVSFVHAATGVYTSVPLKKVDEPLLKAANDSEALFVRRGLVYNDPDLQAYVQSVADKILPRTTDAYIRYRISILRDSIPNAFAMPDGQIYIHSGMLALMENEAQLASLIGHEANHVAGHHSILAHRDLRNKAITGAVAGSIVGIFGGSAAAYGLNLLLVTSLFNFSRDLEEEADQRAVARVIEAGYNVQEMPRLFALMMEDTEGLRPTMSTMWSTHPMLAQRVLYLSARPEIRNFDDLNAVVGIEAFNAASRDVAIRTIQDDIDGNYPREAIRLTQTLRERYGDDAELLTELGDAWRALGPRSPESQGDVTNKQKKKNVRARLSKSREEAQDDMLASIEGRMQYESNMKQAMSAYLAALALDVSYAPAHEGLGEAQFALAAHRDAARSFQQYLKLEPQALDRSIVMDRMREIVRELKAQRARESNNQPEE